MLWLIEAAKEKDDEQRFYDVLAKELVAASQNQVESQNKHFATKRYMIVSIL